MKEDVLTAPVKIGFFGSATNSDGRFISPCKDRRTDVLGVTALGLSSLPGWTIGTSVLGSARNRGEISPDWRKKMKLTLQLAIKNGFWGYPVRQIGDRK